VVITKDDTAERAAYWPVAVARAIPAALLALAITFSANHSARFGLIAFGAFGIVSGAVLFVSARRRLGPSGVRSFFVAQAVITAVAGVLALSFNGGGVRLFFLLVTSFAAITGFLEIYSGIRTRRRFVGSVDWIAVGVFTAVAAVVFLLVPPAYTQTYKGPDGVVRVLDAAVVSVGLLGAYAAIVAVYLLIAGFSAKWGTQATPGIAAPPSSPESETTA
jgi:uncharacterized membrane protein HdeD (DUF308 family)